MREQFTIRQEGERVLIIKNGVLIADMPWEAGIQLSRAIYEKSKLAEQHAKAEAITNDQALLIRAGAPFGLTSHPVILKQAIKEAISNRDLRRYLPGGIRSTEIVGQPTIIQHPPKGDKEQS